MNNVTEKDIDYVNELLLRMYGGYDGGIGFSKFKLVIKDLKKYLYKDDEKVQELIKAWILIGKLAEIAYGKIEDWNG